MSDDDRTNGGSGKVEAEAKRLRREQKQAKEKAKEEKLRREHKQAQKQINALLNKTRPKNFREGMFHGMSNIIAGAVGAVGIAIMAPTAGMFWGCEECRLGGGIFGLICGALVGVCGACMILTKGVFDGVTQMVRGCCAIPDAMTQPRRGRWWDENDGAWVETDLRKTKEDLTKFPDNDEDILGAARKDVEKKKSDCCTTAGEVKETFYYDVLEVDTAATMVTIKRQYYILVRKYHPDKVGRDDEEAAEKFNDVAKAYQVLSDQELRAKYDREGREGLSADKTTAASTLVVDPDPDPALLFGILFGSDQFQHYIGTLAAATSASVADSTKVSISEARMLQKRRCARLALSLADRLDVYVKGGAEEAMPLWRSEGEELAKAKYGYELIHLIGQVYCLSAVQFLGSLDSGIGLPSVSKWAASYAAGWKRYGDDVGVRKDSAFTGLAVAQMQVKFKHAMAKAKTDEERGKIQEDFQKEMTATALCANWTTTIIDITSTLHETSQMVLFDVNVDKATRKKRGEGLKLLGETLVAVPKPENDEGDDNTQKLYQEAAFAAMLKTVKGKDEAAFMASLRK